MGKALVIVALFYLFIVFFIVRMLRVGNKEAYEYVFDPTAKDKQTKTLVAACMLRVNHKQESYTRKAGELTVAILELTAMVQSLFFEKGYEVDSAIARGLVCEVIVMGGHASRQEVARACAEPLMLSSG
ncbi:MAG: hypothetical protein EOP82_05525 [Variovorax sp.]|nr:MAG: hypothetical protein EOP82_05525 [Variovorax sp.]